MTNHVCHTRDGVEIKIGLRVIDYDNRLGTVVAAPDEYELRDAVCWPEPGHNGHWWRVVPDGASPGAYGSAFDGSRLTTREVAARERVQRQRGVIQ